MMMEHIGLHDSDHTGFPNLALMKLSAERRALALRDAGVDVFAQPYRDFENHIEPTQEQRDFAQWVNLKPIFKSTERFKDMDRPKFWRMHRK